MINRHSLGMIPSLFWMFPSVGFLATLTEFLYTIIVPLKKKLSIIDLHYAVDPNIALFAKEDRLDPQVAEWYKTKENSESAEPSLASKLHCPDKYNSATRYFFYFCALYARVFNPLFEQLERLQRYLNNVCPNGIQDYTFTDEKQYVCAL